MCLQQVIYVLYNILVGNSEFISYGEEKAVSVAIKKSFHRDACMRIWRTLVKSTSFPSIAIADSHDTCVWWEAWLCFDVGMVRGFGRLSITASFCWVTVNIIDFQISDFLWCFFHTLTSYHWIVDSYMYPNFGKECKIKKTKNTVIFSSRACKCELYIQCL